MKDFLGNYILLIFFWCVLGIATQTILTIPVNHVNSNDQMVNLALNNGQVVQTSLANLQAMAQPHHLLTSVANTSKYSFYCFIILIIIKVIIHSVSV